MLACLRRALACRGRGPLRAVGMTDSGQFRREMEASWDLVDRKYDAPEIFGEKAAAALCAMSARAAHHDLPLALSLMAGTVALANGATVSVFPGTCSPLMLCVLNINYPQTRKSSSFGMLAKLAHKLDQCVLTRARAKETAFLQEHGSDDAGDEALSEAQIARRAQKVKVASSTLTTFTEAAFFKRVSGDLEQVVDGATIGRVHFGCLINLDEGYKFLRVLGLIAEKRAGGKDARDVGVAPDSASEFNRLLQTGTASLTTKTSGTFGEGNSPAVSMGLAGNAHPSVVVPMERGDVGINHAAAAERLLLVTARPIEPHSPLDPSLVLPIGFKRWLWPRLMACNAEYLGLPADIHLPHVACRELKIARPPDVDKCDSDDEGENDRDFEPDASGYRITLADGVESRLRFRKVLGRSAAEETRLVP